jgi:hypothetical protein
MFKNKAILLMASAVLAMPLAVQAQGATPTAAGKGGTVGADQIIERYKSFAGGEANAKSLVNGLRNGNDITLSWEEKSCSAFQCTVPETTQSCAPGASTTSQTCTMQKCTAGTPGCLGGFKQVCTTTTTCNQYISTPTGKCLQFGTECATWGGVQTKSDTFSPKPAAPMGFGNVDIALALTEAKLRPNATPSAPELKGALVEILGKRAGGEGWGEIAKSYGFELK